MILEEFLSLKLPQVPAVTNTDICIRHLTDVGLITLTHLGEKSVLIQTNHNDNKKISKYKQWSTRRNCFQDVDIYVGDCKILLVDLISAWEEHGYMPNQ